MKKEKFAVEIRKRRLARKLPINDFADLMGVTRQTITEWESARILPNTANRLMIREELGQDLLVDGYDKEA